MREQTPLAAWEARRSTFPDPRRAPADGPFAFGGDLSPERLLDAYAHGIFPWFENDSQPPFWWSPDPRAVVPPAAVHISKSLAKRLRSGYFRIAVDTAFEQVVAGCAGPRPGSGGTWITPSMRSAYRALHRAGYAHSVEAWRGDELAGGLYGVSLGRMFFGESMFSRVADASKAALVHLAAQLQAWDFALIDCQIMNPHLRSLGARPMPRREFLRLVAANRHAPTRRGLWRFDVPDFQRSRAFVAMRGLGVQVGGDRCA